MSLSKKAEVDHIVCTDPKSTYFGINDTGQEGLTIFPALIRKLKEAEEEGGSSRPPTPSKVK